MKTVSHRSIFEEINLKSWNEKGIEAYVLREDLVHPFISGNKWRKLKYNLQDFFDSGKKILLSFGGVYSNHLIATAAATMENKIRSIGIIRGEDTENEYLKFMRRMEMKLHFVTRENYRQKEDELFQMKILNELITNGIIDKDEADDVFIIPEGGANLAGIRGASEIMDEIPGDCEFVVCACGTGTTIAGISQRLSHEQKAIGISVLNANGYFEKQMEKFGGDNSKTIFSYDYHFGGYAKKNKLLLDYCEDFFSATKIRIEPIYTGKMFFAMDQMIRNDYFKRGTKVTMIHTGGVFIF